MFKLLFTIFLAFISSCRPCFADNTIDTITNVADPNSAITTTTINNNFRNQQATLLPLQTPNVANGAVVLDSTGKLPAVDGSLLTNVAVTVVGTANPVAQTSFTMGGLSPGNRYQLILNLTQNTSIGQIRMTSSGDVGATYSSLILEFSQGSTAVSTPVNTNFDVLSGLNNPDAGGFYNSVIYLQNDQGSTSKFKCKVLGGMLSSGVLKGFYNFISYTGATTLSSITISTTAGTITGNAVLLKIG